ncbi:ABC transporter permease [Rhizobium jaguaris]|uniref:ABC transporter permease n=1 Tax=Rhizobium jaguaris TaxID=1312183 RepID=A0A387FXH2_9HYPH|nr:ABC transporter permease [Rhizobium jaguaris]AYG63379.1 ABC transporter permease [Rhizobium jaguaris]
MIDFAFFADTFRQLLGGMPLTLALTGIATVAGLILALVLAAMRLSSNRFFDWPARFYIFCFRGSPLLVQIFLIYYGLSQFPELRRSILWPYLRDPFWCASLALSLNTAAYASEVFRGGFLSVPKGMVEAARACGMSRSLTFRHIIAPLALRQALPAYGNEIILIVKASSLASTVTLMEVTGIAAGIIAETYRPIEVFICAAAIYLTVNFIVTRAVQAAEYVITPERRS